jgi:hypothetical protein
MSKIQQGFFKKKLIAVAILAPAMALTACSNNNSAAAPTQSTSGVAYDGYLRGANMCVDLNLNKQCDDGEPATTTTAGGQYTIAGLTEEQSKLPLVLKAIKDVTIDEDDGQPVDNDFTYLAPAGSKTVSAFSTIIQVKKERLIASGVSAAEAEAQAKRSLANDLDIDPNIDLTDYDAVADSGVDTDGQLAANLHLVNQILTRIIINAQVSLGGAGDANPGAALLAVVDKVSAKAGLIKAKVVAALEVIGSVAFDLNIGALDGIVGDIQDDADTQPDAITQADLDQAAADAEAAKTAILNAAEPDTPATGAGGSTN